MPKKDRFEGWPAEERVCFIPHVRKNGKGREQFRVTAADLKKIVENTNKSVTSETYPIQLIGHRDPDLPDTEQKAEPIGYADRFWIGEHNGDPAILCRLRVDPKSDYASAKELRRYPYLSVEYVHGSKKIIGVSRLMRQPYLDVGVSSYGLYASVWDDPRRVVCYALEPYAMPMEDNDDKFDEKIYEHVKKRLMKDYAGLFGGAEPGGSGSSGGIPKLDLDKPKLRDMDDDEEDKEIDEEPMPPSLRKEMRKDKDEDKAMNFADPVAATRYHAARRTSRQMTLKQRRRRAEEVVEKLVSQGLALQASAATAEVNSLLTYEDSRWQERVDYLKSNYRWSDPHEVHVASYADVVAASPPRDRDGASRAAAEAAVARAATEGYTNYAAILSDERKKRNLD
jgi:hypothetical protein